MQSHAGRLEAVAVQARAAEAGAAMTPPSTMRGDATASSATLRVTRTNCWPRGIALSAFALELAGAAAHEE
ncbi:MAG: hypothetical protein MSC31_02490 [Solirubrobacteraceae bacterium MAG38_C4-C5]|nr:hypothetical protein [Candidatus Siliceabacter maunaloa]